ncbi:MAG TPA: paraquat-inducible protein A [Acetobacteraceae bacterium]|nr:paraquat-inducible protein A [Acetobacteraceae bacterium]
MIIACPDCGTIQRLPLLRERSRLLCCRCDNVLERTAGRSQDAALALALATLVMWIPANLTTLMSLQVLGMERSTRLGSGVIAMWNEGWPELALVVGLQGVILPFVRFGLLSAALASIRFGFQGGWTGPVFRWAQRLDLWAMPDVFLLGAVVGYSRVQAQIPVTIGPGGWSLIAAASLTMLTRASLDTRSVWRSIQRPDSPPAGPRIACTECDLVLPARMNGGRCPRCAAKLAARKPYAVARATALVAAGYPLYLAANYFPMNVQTKLGQVDDQTILYGVDRLLSAGFWPLAAIIFTASILIPVGKLIGMSWLLWSVHRHSDRRLKRKTRIYRFIEEIGRWSNIDIFTIAIFLPIMQLDGFVTMRAGVGAPAFLSVIVLTMIAARLFDPRLMWDNAGERT